MDEERNTEPEVNPAHVDAVMPIVKSLAESTERQIQHALKPLEARIAALEEQLARLTDESKS